MTIPLQSNKKNGESQRRYWHIFKECHGCSNIIWCTPEEYWPYDVEKYDRESPAFLFLAGNCQAIKYIRFDPTGLAKNVLLLSIMDSISKALSMHVRIYCLQFVTAEFHNW